MKLKKVKLSEIKPWGENPRDISREGLDRLKKQITDLGQHTPLIVDEEGNVLGGNMRYRAMSELNWEEVWVAEVNAPTYADKLRYNLSSNDKAGHILEEKLREVLLKAGSDINLSDFKVDLGISTDLEVFLGDPLNIPEPEGNDNGLTFTQEFQIIIECKDEDEQQTIYNKLTQEGLKCKVLTL